MYNGNVESRLSNDMNFCQHSSLLFVNMAMLLIWDHPVPRVPYYMHFSNGKTCVLLLISDAVELVKCCLTRNARFAMQVSTLSLSLLQRRVVDSIVGQITFLHFLSETFLITTKFFFGNVFLALLQLNNCGFLTLNLDALLFFSCVLVLY